MVPVKVLDIDRDRQRISLGLKQTQEDPWQRVVDTYNVGDELEGKVTKVVTFGAFVEIMDGVEGLVHISELAQHHVENPREIVEPGDDGEGQDPRDRLRAPPPVAERQARRGPASRPPDAARIAPAAATTRRRARPRPVRGGVRRPDVSGAEDLRAAMVARGAEARRGRPAAEDAAARGRRGRGRRGRAAGDEAPAEEAARPRSLTPRTPQAEPERRRGRDAGRRAEARRRGRRRRRRDRRGLETADSPAAGCPVRRPDRRHRRPASPRRSPRSSELGAATLSTRRGRARAARHATRCATRCVERWGDDVLARRRDRPRRRRGDACSATPRTRAWLEGAAVAARRRADRGVARGARARDPRAAGGGRRGAAAVRGRDGGRSSTRRSPSWPTRRCAPSAPAPRARGRRRARRRASSPRRRRRQRADYVVRNDGTLEELKAGAVATFLPDRGLRPVSSGIAARTRIAPAAPPGASPRASPRARRRIVAVLRGVVVGASWSPAIVVSARSGRRGPGDHAAAAPRGHHPPAGAPTRTSTRRWSRPSSTRSRSSATRPRTPARAGLMQITPDTARLHRPATPAAPRSCRRTSPRPQINISYGTYYLRYLLDRYDGNETLARGRLQRRRDQRRPLGRARRAASAPSMPRGHPVPRDAGLRRQRRGAQGEYRDHYGDELGLWHRAGGPVATAKPGLGPATAASFDRRAEVQAQPDLHADRRPAGGARRARGRASRRATASRRCSASRARARRPRWRSRSSSSSGRRW